MSGLIKIYGKTVAVIIAVIGWFALGLQFFLMVKNAPSTGLTHFESVVNFFSYFTILSNLIVVISLTNSVLFPRSFPGIFFSSPVVQTSANLYILIVGIVYSIALRNVWNPKGLQKIADLLLHDVIPVLYFIFWVLFVPKKTLQWKHAFSWLGFPLVYLFYTLIRGTVTGWFPYFFLNVSEYGWGKVVVNISIVLLAFLCVAFLLIWIDRFWPAKKVKRS